MFGQKVHKPSRLDDHVRFLDIAREHVRKRMYTLPGKYLPPNELTDPLSHRNQLAKTYA
jgi:hypothetical protein